MREPCESKLVRAVTAERETAVRAALGASKSQLVMARLAESLIVAIAVDWRVLLLRLQA